MFLDSESPYSHRPVAIIVVVDGESPRCAELFSWRIRIWSLRTQVVVMPVVAVVPAVVAAAAPFPVIAVGPVAGVVMASLHSIVNAEAAAIRI